MWRTILGICRIPTPTLKALAGTTFAAITCICAGTANAHSERDRADAEAQEAADAQPDYKHFDELVEPGLVTSFPGSTDSVLGDAGGLRSAMAKENVGLTLRSSNIFVTSLNDSGQPRSPQRYNGQRPTLQAASVTALLAWRLDKLGLPDTTLTAGGMYYASSFRDNAPSTVALRALSIHHRAFGGKLEIKAGYLTNMYEYAGFFTGGSPVLAAGLSGVIPIQAGMSADPVATPAVNITLHGSGGKYVRAGIQRSMHPLGRGYDVEHNHNGFRFTMPEAKPLYLAETGVLRASTPGVLHRWLRVGGLYNESGYTRFDGRGTSTNQAAYAAADFQLTQKDPSRPASGIYAGASAFWGNPSVNVFTQSYEARVYAIGPFPSRKRDAMSLKVSYNKFSEAARRAQSLMDVHANADQTSISGSYTAHLGKGLYATPSLSWVHNPSFIGRFNNALLSNITIFTIF
ncbi:carbohydrate porin [Novosphingobium sp. HR1a]|nr:carbohydrate porin [Novosphingobium sp. HR1a]